MDDSKPRSNNLDRPPSSAHVIDLRQGATSAPLKAPPSAKAAPKAQPARPRPTPPPAPAAPPRPVSPKPAARTERSASKQAAYVDAPFTGKSRFWPAFWRFLLLLTILGVIVVAGVYVYLNYLTG